MSIAGRGTSQWPAAGGWASALTTFAKTPNPATKLASDIHLRSDTHTLTIYDGFAKSQFHFLILPRIPFTLEATSGPSQSGISASADKLSNSSVPPAHLMSLNALLASPHASVVLKALRKAADELIPLIKDEQEHLRLPSAYGSERAGTSWPIRAGFHAVPSMETVHLHVISDDLVSDRLKNKKHYQSFRPGHGFWLDLEEVEALVQGGTKKLPHSAEHYESLLKAPLVSWRDGSSYANMPQLKKHLEESWVEDIRKRRSTATASNKKRDDEAKEKKRRSASP